MTSRWNRICAALCALRCLGAADVRKGAEDNGAAPTPEDGCGGG